jgi:adsorption protein B
LRDRRGPLTALVLAVAYLLLALVTLGWFAELAGFSLAPDPSPVLFALLAENLAGFAWRAIWRFAFTAREYGIVEGVRSLFRIPVANVIAIMAGRRALWGYVASLGGRKPDWDKTRHTIHPAIAQEAGASR